MIEVILTSMNKYTHSGFFLLLVFKHLYIGDFNETFVHIPVFIWSLSDAFLLE